MGFLNDFLFGKEGIDAGRAGELDAYSRFAGDEVNRSRFGDQQNVANALMQYGQGNMSLADAAGTGGNQAQMQQLIATDPMAARQFAQEQTLNDPRLAQLFDTDTGLMGQLGQEGDELAQRGYSLKPEDFEAYGQASGNIARQFGRAEQSLANTLASRGFGGANSNIAASGFSGLAGNKLEQLGQLQRSIANDRMENTRNRLMQNRQMQSQLGQQYAGELGNQVNRQMAGRQLNEQQRQSALNQYGQNAQMQQQQRDNAFNQREQTRTEGVIPGAARGFVGQLFGGAGGTLAQQMAGAGQKQQGQDWEPGSGFG